MHDELSDHIEYHFPDPQNPTDFYLINNKADYDILKDSGFNVLYQNSNRIDDGSLSRKMSEKNIRYLNIEVFLGRDRKNQTMLEFAANNL